ncbi:hypothetical protein [Streptomyces sp. NBC_00557]|uniref:hypothetical protein n=1 Tax=Streptomyces sp. NBC_00557 TaxID=2975776 RepID=UPI002E80BFB4|nr:hypothetical protein [Streptomyces sp. NBC_00557]WUC35759.1 hypothetical protein OG956_16775 [Streptomyces sp. NBC_00557]
MTSLFSALEEQPRSSAAASPRPATNPFQAPDFVPDSGYGETSPLAGSQESGSSLRAAQAEAARRADRNG